MIVLLILKSFSAKLKVILRLKNIYALYDVDPFTDHNAPINILQIALCIVY